jgi:hypothetical protein
MLRRRPVGMRDWSGRTPMEAQAWKTGGCLTDPPGTFAGNWESRKAFVQAPYSIQRPKTNAIDSLHRRERD